MMIVPNDATHAAVVITKFADGGDDEEMVVHMGSFEECDRAARLMDAVSYSGARRAESASVSVFRLHPLCDACNCRHDLQRPCA